MSETIEYNRLASIIFKQMNMYRNDPQLLIPILEQRLSKYDEKKFMPSGDPNLVLQTEEGPKAVEELIESLRNEPKYPKFEWSYELHQAANYKANAISAQSRGRQVQIPENIEELVSEYAEWNGSLSQLIVYGLCDPNQIICELLIDDGNMERDNRREFFNTSLHGLGLGIATHSKYQFVIVFVLATQAEKRQNMFHKYRNSLQPESLEEAPECRGCSTF